MARPTAALTASPPQPEAPALRRGPIANDQETLDLYFGHARDGRLALWLYVVDDAAAGRAIRHLADCQILPIRHYGQRQSDFYLARPRS
jgi:hypothetical protein